MCLGLVSERKHSFCFSDWFLIVVDLNTRLQKQRNILTGDDDQENEGDDDSDDRDNHSDTNDDGDNDDDENEDDNANSSLKMIFVIREQEPNGAVKPIVSILSHCRNTNQRTYRKQNETNKQTNKSKMHTYKKKI